VKIIGVQDSTLQDCVKDAQRERVVLTRRGKPVALVIGVTGLDLEQIELGQSDEFWRLIRRRRGQKTVSRAELERRLEKQKPGRK
jgi:antitoxin (DNA-binding transcriptional repressor) of toxin-antitoxin stability system